MDKGADYATKEIERLQRMLEKVFCINSQYQVPNVLQFTPDFMAIQYLKKGIVFSRKSFLQ